MSFVVIVCAFHVVRPGGEQCTRAAVFPFVVMLFGPQCCYLSQASQVGRRSFSSEFSVYFVRGQDNYKLHEWSVDESATEDTIHNAGTIGWRSLITVGRR